ncbi:hypothetical protein K525DRAFT_254591 [Schizophyllum commune Loenen D]|nr:hypothetical protein K525DRAFT_254591 [Schizophyllum commune Loenen D]
MSSSASLPILMSIKRVNGVEVRRIITSGRQGVCGQHPQLKGCRILSVSRWRAFPEISTAVPTESSSAVQRTSYADRPPLKHEFVEISALARGIHSAAA